MSRAFIEQWKKDADALLERVMRGGDRPVPRRETALAYRGGAFVSLEIGDDGKVIEPCRKCGPMLLCSECMLRVT